MIIIKNNQLVDVINYLTEIELQPKVSRVRTKLINLMKIKMNELSVDELELLEKFGMKDEKGKLIENEGTFHLIPESAREYHKEKSELLDEDCEVNVSELKSKLSLLVSGLEDSEVKVSGRDAEVLDLILDCLEMEGKHDE
jgi:hypothetical protein